MYTGGTAFSPTLANSSLTNWGGKVTVDQGYDVVNTLGQARKQKALKRTNGQLHDGKYFFNFFVTDVEIDIALGGSTAQSRYKQDFYPKNFVQPSFTITGVCLDQVEYGVLCEFIHQSQHKSLHHSGRLTQLLVKGDTWKFKKKIHVNKNGQQTVKGPRRPVVAKGHIGSIARAHEKFVYSPVFTFSFVVDDMISGIYSEDTVTANELQTWSDIMQAQLGVAPVVTSDTKQVTTGTSNLPSLDPFGPNGFSF